LSEFEAFMRTKPAGASSRLSFIDFQLPSLSDAPPEGDGWIHEIKHDGYRTQLIIERGKARALTRRAFDWSAKYAPIVEAAAALPVKTAIVDGEVVVFNEKGQTDFQALRSAMRWAPGRLVFIAFDLLHFNGEDLRKLPLIERRSRLAALLMQGDGGAIQFSEHVLGSGACFFREVDRLGLEGMVSKRASSIYKSGRTETWLKTKCFTESVYEVAGVLREPGRPAVAYMVTPDAERRYVGGAFITLNAELRERLWARVQAKARPVKGVGAKAGIQWLKPGLIARVRYLKGEEGLRHATLRQIVED
jgi:bifunctional non-homologous end joining protein LigD